MIHLVWMRNDLRLHDHAPLVAALASGKPVLPFYCFDDKDFEQLPIGLPKTGAHRAKVLFEAVADVHAQIAAFNAGMAVVRGSTSQAIAQLHQQYGLAAIHAFGYPTPEEQQREQEVAELGIPLHLYEGHSLLHPKDLPFAMYQLPKVFTAFRKKVEQKLVVRAPLAPPEKWHAAIPPQPLPAPTALKLHFEAPDTRTAFPFEGGERAGLARLENYFWDTSLVDSYKSTRNGLIGADYSTKFSTYLAHGGLSARKIYHELKAYETSNGSNEGTYWVFFELLWRDFFYFQAMAQGGAFFKFPENHQPKLNNSFNFWTGAKTRDPFVDAAMRELAATGYTSNRMRQNIASFLIHNLKGNWIAGAQYFESLLIDYDCASNYGNWTYLAGSGNDPRDNRVFNTKRQADMYDPDGSYQAFWQS